MGLHVARLIAKLWYVKMLSDQQTVPVPRDEQEFRSGASDPDRVLLIGNGPTHGWGTVTHQLALTGQLARTFTRSTGRPADVRYVGAETMNLASTVAWLGDERLDGYDLILVVLSMNDAVRLTPARAFRADMERLLAKIVREADPATQVVVAGIHPVASLPHYRGLAARIGQRHADALNAITRSEVGRHDGVTFMELDAPPAEVERPYGSPAMYEDWSRLFADTCVPALEWARSARTGPTAAVAPEREWGWQPAGRVIERSLDHGGELAALAEGARADLDVDIAYITLIDGSRQYYVANTGPGSRDVPLELTHCSETIRGDDMVVVENSFKDARFKDSPLIDLTQLRFYAGVPLKSETGENIGTFCVSSVLPRSRRTVPEAVLRGYADQAERELHRLAAQESAEAAAALQ